MSQALSVGSELSRHSIVHKNAASVVSYTAQLRSYRFGLGRVFPAAKLSNNNMSLYHHHAWPSSGWYASRKHAIILYAIDDTALDWSFTTLLPRSIASNPNTYDKACEAGLVAMIPMQRESRYTIGGYAKADGYILRRISTRQGRRAHQCPCGPGTCFKIHSIQSFTNFSFTPSGS